VENDEGDSLEIQMLLLGRTLVDLEGIRIARVSRYEMSVALLIDGERRTLNFSIWTVCLVSHVIRFNRNSFGSQVSLLSGLVRTTLWQNEASY
jgi:hypothetical protein